ncbi:MAG TPA: hypothetical protein VGP24_04715 [Glaciihabitans sp.]|jgi:hypothetical protein|nr:hypothetical protein [Glaciihabitans sp.]
MSSSYISSLNALMMSKFLPDRHLVELPVELRQSLDAAVELGSRLAARGWILTFQNAEFFGWEWPPSEIPKDLWKDRQPSTSVSLDLVNAVESVVAGELLLGGSQRTHPIGEMTDEVLAQLESHRFIPPM